MADEERKPGSSRDVSSPTNEDATEFTPKQSSSPIAIKQSQTSTRAGLNVRDRSPVSPGLMTDANGEPIPIDKIIKTANTMSTMMMAHKIALEDDFRLEPGMDISGPLMSLSPIIGSSPSKGACFGNSSGEPSLQSKVKNIVHEAYWNLFREEIDSQKSETKEERNYEISKQLLCDIKSRIIDLLLPQHSRLKQEIEDKLDPAIIDQLSRVDSLDLLDYARYILSVLSKLCAPVRDERLKELSEIVEPVQLYRGIMDLLEMMRLDFANFTLNSFKPHIKAHSQEYEREKFKEILAQQQTIGIDGLEYTKIWLSRAVEKIDSTHGIADLVNESSSDLVNEELNPNTVSDIGTSSKISCSNVSKKDKILSCDIVNKVLNAGYCELLEWSSKVQKLYPETLVFDEATFKQLGEQYKMLVLTSSILLTTFAFVNQYKLHDNNEFRNLAKSHIITLLTASYDSNQTVAADAQKSSSIGDTLDQVKLETIVSRLSEDIRQKLTDHNPTAIESFEGQKELFRRQILDLQNQSNRIRELSRRRILEFVETLLNLDIEHQQKKFSKLPPPVNIPLGLNCLADEITLTMAQVVKIIRYNRRVFFQHYQDIIVDLVTKYMPD